MRISLIVAILAALGAGTLNVLQVRDKINTLMTQRDEYHTNLTSTQSTLDSTKKDLANTKTSLAQTQQERDVARTAQKKAEDARDLANKNAADMTDKLAKANQDLSTAQADLAAYKATGKSPTEIGRLDAQIRQYQKEIAALTDESKLFARDNTRLKNELKKYTGPATDITLPADLKGKVVVVDPKWDFVVLDVGDEQGVLDNGELLVSRDGKLVAKVIVRTVEKGRCIANIMSGWKLGEVFEGDVVTPAHPAS